MSTDAIYCIGTKKNVTPTPTMAVENKAPAGAAVAHVQVVPAEVMLKPGEKPQFKVLTYDANGKLIGPAHGVQWSIGSDERCRSRTTPLAFRVTDATEGGRRQRRRSDGVKGHDANSRACDSSVGGELR